MYADRLLSILLGGVFTMIAKKQEVIEESSAEPASAEEGETKKYVMTPTHCMHRPLILTVMGLYMLDR